MGTSAGYQNRFRQRSEKRTPVPVLSIEKAGAGVKKVADITKSQEDPPKKSPKRTRQGLLLPDNQKASAVVDLYCSRLYDNKILDLMYARTYFNVRSIKTPTESISQLLIHPISQQRRKLLLKSSKVVHLGRNDREFQNITMSPQILYPQILRVLPFL